MKRDDKEVLVKSLWKHFDLIHDVSGLLFNGDCRGNKESEVRVENLRANDEREHGSGASAGSECIVATGRTSIVEKVPTVGKIRVSGPWIFLRRSRSRQHKANG